MRAHVNGRLTAPGAEHSRWLRHVEPAGCCALRDLRPLIVDRDGAASGDRIRILANPVRDPSISLAILAGGDLDP
jgi:hypothetical protein